MLNLLMNVDKRGLTSWNRYPLSIDVYSHNGTKLVRNTEGDEDENENYTLLGTIRAARFETNLE